mmetsp:Transcript_15871/g.34572  ORF Transcript_15871/g.34572 Transcript_15871/m.34572 type:complete len:230 (-) Transcript_15871:556-1245(-)
MHHFYKSEKSTSSHARPAYAAAIAHANDPAQHRFLCASAAFANVASSAGDSEGFRFAIPSAHAARAHANVSPYAGADRDRVRPTPNAVAATADECPSATSDAHDEDSSEAREPLRFTSVAAVVQPKCIVSGASRTDSVDDGSAAAVVVAATPAEWTSERLHAAPASAPALTYFSQPPPSSPKYDGRKDAHHSDWNRFAATNGAVIRGRSADAAPSEARNCAAANAASPR